MSDNLGPLGLDSETCRLKYRLSVCYIIENENNDYFKASLKSIDSIADEIIIIDGGSTDGTLEYIASLNNSRIKVFNIPYQHKSKGADGRQRNEYLKVATGDWILVLDADEIVDDGALLFKTEYMETNTGFEVFDIHMEHFFYNFGLLDASFAGQPQFDPNYVNYVPRRFFKRVPGLNYAEVEHPVLLGNFKDVGKIDDIVIYHLAEVKGQLLTFKKYRNQVKKSNMHNPTYLKWWKEARLMGEYPVKPITLEDISSTIIKRMIIDD